MRSNMSIMSLAFVLLKFCKHGEQDMRSILRTGLSIIVLGLLVVSIAAPAYAATINVTTRADQNGNGLAQCSLREAIQAANTDSAFGGCPAGSGADTINLGAFSYTLALGSELTITSDINVIGAGITSTRIRGASTPNTNSHRVFTITSGTVTFQDLSVVNGGNGSVTAGGGILVSPGASLTLVDVGLARNTAQSGGGISSGGTLNFTDTIIRNNSAQNAGGLALTSGSLTYNGGLVRLNNATGGGGGFGILNADVTLNTVYVTNNAGGVGAGGVAIAGGSLDMNDGFIEFNTADDGSAVAAGGGATVSVNSACVVGNEDDIAVVSDGTTVMDFTTNWWGDAQGPYDVTMPSPTAGDSVDGTVTYAGFLTSAPSECGICTVVSTVSNGRSLRVCTPSATPAFEFSTFDALEF